MLNHLFKVILIKKLYISLRIRSFLKIFFFYKSGDNEIQYAIKKNDPQLTRIKTFIRKTIGITKQTKTSSFLI